MKVLVTGATGFLGGVMARDLVAAGHEVWGVGRNRTQGQALERAGVRFLPLDLHQAEALRQHVAQVDSVVHAAARSTLWGRWPDFVADNVEVSAEVARACTVHGVRLVHISTPSVYNATGVTAQVPETTRLGPHFDSLYAQSKYLAELEIQLVCPEATLLRPRGIYGPGDTSIVPRLARALRSGRLPRLAGEGTPQGEVWTELTAVGNVSHAIRLALTRPAPGVYNITDGVPIPLWSTIDRLADALGVPRPSRPASPRRLEAVARGLELLWTLHPQRAEPPLTASGVRLLTRGMTLDLRRARERLGYAPVVHPDEAIPEALSEALSEGRAAAHA